MYPFSYVLLDDFGANGFAGAPAESATPADAAPGRRRVPRDGTDSQTTAEAVMTPAAPEVSDAAVAEAAADADGDAHARGPPCRATRNSRQAAADAGLDKDDDEAAPAATPESPAEAGAPDGRARRAPAAVAAEGPDARAAEGVAPNSSRASGCGRAATPTSARSRASRSASVSASASATSRAARPRAICAEKDQATLVRMLALAPRAGEHPSRSISPTPRVLFAAVALVAGHAVDQARPDVSVDDVWFDRSTGAPQSAKPMLRPLASTSDPRRCRARTRHVRTRRDRRSRGDDQGASPPSRTVFRSRPASRVRWISRRPARAIRRTLRGQSRRRSR
jgi:hypothetical protein